MSEDLFLCPFCGHDAEIVPSNSGGFYVRCQGPGCPMETGSTTYATIADAAAAWNSRAEDSR